MEIDPFDKYYEKHDSPEIKQRTITRLEELKSLGLEELGLAQFGIHGVISGIYIESVWNKEDEDWKDYIKFIESVVNN